MQTITETDTEIRAAARGARNAQMTATERRMVAGNWREIAAELRAQGRYEAAFIAAATAEVLAH